MNETTAVVKPARTLTFEVIGTPKGSGSKRARMNKHTGKLYCQEQSNNKEWGARVSAAAVEAIQKLGEQYPMFMQGPLQLSVSFLMPRPGIHYNSKGHLKPNAPRYCFKKPDLSKLVRWLEDCMTGIVWADDRLVSIYGRIEKQYAPGEHPGGAVVTVSELYPASAGTR